VWGSPKRLPTQLKRQLIKLKMNRRRSLLRKPDSKHYLTGFK
jgi:hypothetical protein